MHRSQRAMLNMFVFALPLLFFTVWILIKWFSPSNCHNHFPPSPPRIPILGNLHQLGTRPHRSLQKLAQRYGELMMLRFGSRHVLVVSSAEAAREILKTNDAIFCSKPKMTVFDKLLYGSKDVGTAPYGEYWRQMRSICVLQLLSNKRVRSFRGIREEEVALLVQNVQKSSMLSLPVNLSELFAVVTNDVICSVAFGKKYSGGSEGAIKMKKLLAEFMVLLGSFSVGDFIPWLYWVNQLSGLDARMEKVAKEFDEFYDTIVEEHMVNLSTNMNACGEEGEDRKDMVDILLELQEDNNGSGISIDRDSIKAVILDMFIGGTDTTSTVLEWAMTELIRHPKVMRRLQNEVMEAASDKHVIRETDLEEMPYLKAVIKETMRLYPPLPLGIMRNSLQDAKVKGYDLPKEIMVLVNTWTIGRDPCVWDEPDEFQPERFLNSSVDLRGQNYELIPFGSGRRGCPGVLFAIANNELVLANLVHKFDWTLPSESRVTDIDMSECTGLVIHREVPLMAMALPKSC